MRIVLIFTLFLAPLFGVEAQDDPESILQDAERQVSLGNLNQAVVLYQSVKSLGVDNWELHYNLGNLFLKLGRGAEAIASYRRARVRNPRVQEISHNLSLAREKVGLWKRPLERGGIFAVREIVSSSEGEVLAIVMLALLLGALAFSRFRLAILLLVPSLYFTVGFLLLHRTAGDTLTFQDIEVGVLLDGAKLYSLDSESSQVVEVARWGEECDLFESRGEFFRVRAPSGRVGWVARERVLLEDER